jgi:DNA polymerase III subunit epsilon
VNILSRFTKAARRAPHQAAAVAEYRSLAPLVDDALLAETRLVIVDVETSGLDPYRDRLISIGAVGVTTGLVQFEDSFKVVLRQPRASSDLNIVVHGIDGTSQLAGTHPADALVAWLRFSRKAPLVGFHADFDRIVLARAMQDALGIEPENRWTDVAMLLPALFPGRKGGTLDEWTKLVAIENHARHDPLADAVATAQLLQIALAEAARQGIVTLRALGQLEKDYRWLVQSMRR